MKALIVITGLSLVTLLSSCGKLRTQRTNLPGISKVFTGIGSIEEPAQKNFTKLELDIASRICQALKSKRTALEPVSGKVIYVFNLQRRDCQNKLSESSTINASILLVGGDLEYSVANVSNYFIDVVTDKTLALASICELVLDPATDLNKIKISNTSVVLDKLFTVSFLEVNSYDTLQITTRIKDSKGAFSPSHAEEIAIATNAAQLGAQFVGVEKERTRVTPCTGKEFSTLKESWITAMAPL